MDEGAGGKGRLLLIQFGHNDQKADPARHTDAGSSFQTYLKRYVDDVRAQGGVPVLVTSLSRRTYKDGKVVEDLNAYAEATRKVGAEEYITVIDLNRLSTALLDHVTQAQADAYDAVAHADAKAENGSTAAAAPALDRTHLNPAGQAVFGRMVADQLIRTQVELGPDVMGEAAGKSVVPSFAAPAVAGGMVDGR